jgi:hypothetical protein
MFNKPKKVLIGTDISWNAACVSGATVVTVASNAAAGEVIVFDKNKKILTVGQTVADTDTIFVGQVLAATYDYTGETGVAVTSAKRIRFSDPIEGRLVKSYIKKAYTAKSEQVTTITTTSLVVTAGREHVLRLIYRDLQDEKGGGQFVHSYRYTCISGETTTTINTSWDDLINAHAGRRVQAAGSGTSMTLTAKAIPDCTTGLNDINSFKQVEFDAFLTYIDTNGYHQETLATLATTAAVRGNGTWELVRDAERESLGNKGITNLTIFPVIQPDLTAVKSETYDEIIIEHDKSYLASDNQYTKQTPLKTIIFIPNTATGQGNQMDSILARLNPWMASTPARFNAISF